MVRSEGTGRPPGQATQTTGGGTDGTARSEGIDGRTTAAQKLMSMMVDMKDTITSLHSDIQGLKEQAAKDQQSMKEELQATRDELRAMKEKIQVLEKVVEGLTTRTQALPSGNPSYAEIARTPPSSQQSNVRSLSTNNTTASASTTSPRCTLDTAGVAEKDRSRTEVAAIRQAIEKAMLAKEGQGSWRYWRNFLKDNTNIWQAAKYLKEGNGASGDKIPPLQKTNGETTRDTNEIDVRLSTFFPPLPEHIEEKGERPQRAPVPMPELTMQEVEEKVLTAKMWKAPGNDGLPAAVWAQVWLVVRDRVLLLFQTSLREGALPSQWRTAKIIPLKKADKEDYSAAKAWRPDQILQDKTAGFDKYRCLQGIRSGIEHMHKLGLVHNDINPRNIMMTGKHQS